MDWPTVAEVINDAAVELGLGQVSDAFGSSDANVQQLLGMLKSGGKDLVQQNNWPHLQKEYLFTTVAGQFYYPLPADFQEMIDQTGWNRTTRLPLGGPLSPQEWQYLASRLTGVVFTVLFRPQQQMMHLYPNNGNLTAGYVIAYEYWSRNWIAQSAATPAWAAGATYALGDTVQSNGNTYLCTTAGTAGATVPSGYQDAITDGAVVWQFTSLDVIANTDAPAANTDQVWLNALLAVRRIKLDWLSAKGFDTSIARRQYEETLEATLNSATAAPILNLRGRQSFDPLMSGRNVPITGFGL